METQHQPAAGDAPTVRVLGYALAVPVAGAATGLGLAIAASVVGMAIGDFSGEGDGIELLALFFGSWLVGTVLCMAVAAAVFARVVDLGDRNRLVLGLGFFVWLPLALSVGLGVAGVGQRSGLAALGLPIGLLVAIAALVALATPVRRTQLQLAAASTLRSARR